MEKRHGKLQRLLAMCLSLMMALVLLAPSAFADDGSATITINKGSIKKDLTNMTVKAYLVLDQVNDTENDPAKKQYQVTNKFKDFFAMRDGTDKLAENIKGLFGKADQDVVLTYDGNKITFSQVSTGSTAAAGTIVLTGDDAAQLDETYPEADLVSRLTGSAAGVGFAATFYTWVEKYIEAHVGTEDEPASYNPNWANPKTSTCTDGSTIQFTGLNEGYYALIFSGVPNGVSAKQGILIATNVQTPASMNLKAEEIPLTKQVKNPSASHSSEDYSDNTTANMGDTLDYKITSKVPTLTDTENLTAFNLSDTMEKQMLTAGNTMTLTVGSATFTATIPTIPTDAQSATANFEDASRNVIAVLTVEPYNDTSKTQEFTVDFLQKKQGDALVANDTWTSYQGSDITLEYSAKLTADAVRINGNDVKLFINDWDKPLEDKTEVYTYGIEVEKTFSDGKKYTGVNGATFALKTAKDGTVIRLVKTADGTYHKPGANETANQETLYLDANSKLTITGLDEGTYWLEETHAPAGFTEAEPIKIVLVGSTDKKTLDKDASTAMYNGTGDDLVTGINDNNGGITLAQFEVRNQKGFNLPQTGGAGTWMFTVGGIVLIAAAGALFLASRKKRSSK